MERECVGIYKLAFWLFYKRYSHSILSTPTKMRALVVLVALGFIYVAYARVKFQFPDAHPNPGKIEYLFSNVYLFII